ncbi:CD1107 family mobile element protein, partial [Butyricicoccus pullicaecorum]
MKHKRIISLVLTAAMMLSMCMPGFAVDTGETDAPPTPVTCTCETKCVDGAVNYECPVCSADGANLEACKGAEATTPEPECTCEIQCTEGTVA